MEPREVEPREALATPGASLLLDLDGTLIDSEPASRAAYRHFFASRGWSVSDDDAAAFVGRRAADVFGTLDGPWRGLDAHALARESLTFIDHDAFPPRPLPGAGALLRATRGVVPTAIVTSAPRWWALRVLAILQAEEPDAIVAAESVTHGKPHPEPFARACVMLGADPALAVACDDAPAGVASAVAAGVGTVVGITTHVSAAALIEAGGTASAPDLRALLPSPPSSRADAPSL